MRIFVICLGDRSHAPAGVEPAINPLSQVSGFLKGLKSFPICSDEAYVFI